MKAIEVILLGSTLIVFIGFLVWIAACSADTPYEDRQRIREDIKEWKS